MNLSIKEVECDNFACTPTCTANSCCTVQITVQYRCIFVLLFGRYWLQLDNKLGYLSLDIACSSKFKVFLKLRSRETVRFPEQVMSEDKYPSIFPRQTEAVVYIFVLVSRVIWTIFAAAG